MKKKIFAMAAVMVLILSACGKKNTTSDAGAPEIKQNEILDPLKFEKDNTQSEDFGIEKLGLSLKTKNVTPTSAILLFQQEGGKPTGMLEYGDDFIIERCESNEWKAVPIVIEGNYGFHDIAYSIANNSTTEFEMNWEWLYGKLEPGEYRIGKSVYDFRDTGDYDEYMVYAKFVLN